MFSGTAIFAGAFLLTFCLSSALVPVDNSSAIDSGSGSLTMAFTSEQTIDIAVDKTSVGIEADSTDFNKMLTDSLNVTVSTNNVTGYVLNMAVDSSMTNGATITSSGTTQENVATNALVNTENNKYYLPSITSAITNPTDSTFPVNSWAYSISSTLTNMTYSPLPEAGSSTEIKKVTELTLTEDADGNLTADDITPVTVATKADMSIPAGAYTNKLVFTAITNFNPEYDSYTIAYDANGGTGEMNDQTGYIGEDVTLKSNTFSRTGYNFLGWSTDRDATTAAYTNGQIVEGGLTSTAKEIITLYAIWEESVRNVTVTISTGASGTVTGSGEHNIGDTVTLGGVSTTDAEGHHLLWTATTDNVTLSGATTNSPSFVMPNEDVNIVVTGEANTYNLVYDSNGGTGTIAGDTVTYGQNVTLSSTSGFSRSGYYVVSRWAASSSGEPLYTGSTSVNTLATASNVLNTHGGTIKVYAKWLQSCDYNGVAAFILADGKCWTKNSQGTVTWANAKTKCPSGFSLPTADQFKNMMGKYGTIVYYYVEGSAIRFTTGYSGGYWSSSTYPSAPSNVGVFFVGMMGGDYITMLDYYEPGDTTYGVICIR